MSAFQYDKATGRILKKVADPTLWERLLAPEGADDVTHYVAWTSTDADGRPVDPTVTPRTLLEAVVSDAAGLATVTISGAGDLAEVVVRVDETPQAPQVPEAGQVVVELASPIEKTFSVEVNEPAYYLPRLQVRVLP